MMGQYADQMAVNEARESRGEIAQLKEQVRDRDELLEAAQREIVELRAKVAHAIQAIQMMVDCPTAKVIRKGKQALAKIRGGA